MADTPKPAPPAVPLGAPLAWDAAALDAFTDPAALAAAADEIAQAWRRDAPAAARAMIDAPERDTPARPNG